MQQENSIPQETVMFQDFWNIMLATDSYKASHPKMLPEKLTYMESYLEARGGEYAYSLFFGLQYYLRSYLLGRQVTQEKLEEAKIFYAQHFGRDNVFEPEMWQIIIDEYDGRLPIAISSVPEGSIMPVSNCMLKIWNTDPRCAKLVNWIETLLMKVWSPITVATNSFAGMERIKFHDSRTGSGTGLQFKLHDFGYRGTASEEQSWLCGAANLLTFNGTDTVAGIRCLQKFYGATKMMGFSIPASEHSVMTASGRDHEMETIKSILLKFPTGTLAIVIDTWNVYEVCKQLSSREDIKKIILERDGKLVLRPDSGDPTTVLLKCLEILAEGFGFTVNDKGFKVLNSKIGLIQGDGINIYTMSDILFNLEKEGWSIDNLAFGSGGGLLQKFDRDTMKFAIKASYVIVDGIGMDIYKDPITSQGSKKSKTGMLQLIYTDDGYRTVNQHDEIPDNFIDELKLVYQNGCLMSYQTYDDILLRIDHDLKRLNLLVETN